MKKIVCEVCGSTDFAKKDQEYSCKGCGMCYSVSDIKNLLVEVEEETPVAKEAPIAAEVHEVSHRTTLSVDSQGATVAGEQNLKLLYDLYCWHNFYQKCHELEEVEPFKDELLEKNNDPANTDYSGCIAERIVSFDKDGHFEKVVLPEVKKKYVEIHPEVDQEYEIYKADAIEKRARGKAIVERKTKMLYFLLLFALIPIGICILVTIYNPEKSWSLIVGAIVSVIIGAILSADIKGAFADKVRRDNSKLIPPIHLEKKAWIDSIIYPSSEYIEYEKQKREKYSTLFNENINYINDGIEKLRVVYNDLKHNIPLPVKYSDEYHVDCLLALVVDRRADTLKEAINLLETENYRSNVLASLNELNKNLLSLDAKISALGNMVYQGMTAIMQHNAMISSQISALHYSTESMFVMSMLF